MTNYDRYRKRHSELDAAVRALEAKAGISDKMAALNETSNGWDIREIYFGVPDVALRKALISAYRQRQMHYYDQYFRSQIFDEEGELKRLKREVDNAPWIWPGILACGTVGVGYALASIPGSLAGALVGFFLGQSYISYIRSDNRRLVEECERRIKILEDEEKADRGAMEYEEVFSVAESVMGVEGAKVELGE